MTTSASRSSTPAASSDRLLGELAEELASRLRAGEPIDLETFLADHPDQAEALRPLLPAIRVMADLGRSAARAVAGPDDPVAALGELGDYQILREVGRGGMGVVYEARQISLNRRVALKVLPFAAALDPRQLQRFHNEAQAAAGLHHSNIVPVYAVGCERGVHYYAMQFVEGRSLAEAIRDLRRLRDRESAPESPDPGRSPDAPPTPLSPGSSITGRDFFREVARLGIQAGEALEYAHALGVVHRDVKPANLLLDARGHLWVADFGLARFHAEAGLTMTGDLLGTLRYMSPEQALGRPAAIDGRTDVYSLGVTLYELLTLRPALEGRDRQELLRQIAFEEPPPPRRHNPAIPRELETILLKAIAKEPAERYGTARELDEDLRRFLEHRPIRARRPSLTERAAKWVRRHPALVGSAVVLMVMAVVGLSVGAAVLARKQEEIERQRDIAQERSRLARRAVDQMYTRVAREWLAHQPRMTPLQREFLEEALRSYESFAQESGDDPATRRAVADAFLHVAEIRARMGKQEDAEAADRRAIGIFEALAKAFPGEPEYRDRMAQASLNLGSLLLERGAHKEAEDAYRRALAIWEGLSAGPGSPPASRHGKAKGLESVGFVMASTGRPVEAERHYRQAISLYEGLVEGDPSNPDYRQKLANALNSLGNLLRAQGRPDDAEAAYLRASSTARKLVEELPDRAMFREQFAYMLSNLSVVQQSAKRFSEAQETLAEAIVTQRRLVEDFPAIVDYRERLAAFHNNMGIHKARDGRPKEAIPEYRDARALIEPLIQEHPSVSRYRGILAAIVLNLADAHRDTGQESEAEEEYEEALAALGQVASEEPSVPAHRAELVRIHDHLADLYLRADRPRDSERSRLRCIELSRELARNYPAVPPYRHLLASELAALARLKADTRDPEVCDTARAVEQAEEAVELEPDRPSHRTSLGMALYRAGHWGAAIRSVSRAKELGGTGTIDDLLLALAHARRGETEEARTWYARAAAWMEENDSDDQELLRFRDEAAALLGVIGPTEDETREEGTSAPR